MKVGYSIAIGEHVDAADLDYADISDFKMVCPICRELVHKVERGDQHFLSHKHRTPESQECELRVASLSREQLDTLAGISRGQTLEAFFADLPDMIDAIMPPMDDGIPSWRDLEARFRGRGDALRMRHCCHRFLARNLNADDISDKVDAALDPEGTKSLKPIPRSRLNRALQRRAATDMFRTLMTATGKVGFAQTYWAAWCLSWNKFARLTDEDFGGYNGGWNAEGGVRAPVLAHFAAAAAERVDLDSLVRRSRKVKLFETRRPTAQGTAEYAITVNGAVDNEMAYSVAAILANLDYVAAVRRRQTQPA